MYRTRGRLVVACLAVIGAAIVVAGGSAGNRDLETGSTFQAIPAPGSVTYGENIAYSATLENTNKANFTHVEFRQSRPVATFGGISYYAEELPGARSCGVLETKGDTDPANDEVVCQFGDLAPGDPAEELTIVWKAPTIPSATGCGDCLTSVGTWLIKEAKATNGNETFSRLVKAELLGDQPTQESLRASGYELPRPTACAPGDSNLRTNQSLTKDNPVSSSFCLPPFVAGATQIGLATKITELKGNARQSEVCIAQLGDDCGPGTTPADFGPAVVTFEFRVFNPALRGPITEVFHNGEQLTLTTCTRAVNPECLVSLTYDQNTKIWTIIATSETNGPWNW